MASKGKLKAAIGDGGGEPVKRRKVGFSADSVPVSCSANDCMRLHVVFTAQDLEAGDEDEENTFDPEFAERIFCGEEGEEGLIFGYKGLTIDLWLHALTFHTYVQIRYDSKSELGKKPATDILVKLKEAFGDGLTDDRDAFVNSLPSYSQGFEEMIKQHGEVLSTWRCDTDGALPADGETIDRESKVETSSRLGQILRMELSNDEVRAWHARLTPLALLYIEGARPIESDDPLWEVYLALEGEGDHKRVVGLCNVYRFFHYPDSTRLRISQILVLPPYQGKGFGLHLLETINSTAGQRGCYDVTMEEPSMSLQKLRDTMDVLRMLSTPSMSTAINDGMQRLYAQKATIASEMSGHEAGSTNGDLNGTFQHSGRGAKEKNILAPPAHLVEEGRKHLRISKLQFGRCWEQLLFIYLDPLDKVLQDVFQEALVQRINLELFEKDNEGKGVGKRVVDTDNEYDNTKTFVMMRANRRSSVSANGRAGSSDKEVNDLLSVVNNLQNDVAVSMPAAEDKVKILQEVVKEREEELLGVAQDVARHCTRLGLEIPSIEHWVRLGKINP